MFGRRQLSHWLIGLGLLAAVEGVSVFAVELASIAPAQAQFTDQRYPFLRRQHQRSRGGGFFDSLFGGFHERSRQRAPAEVQQPHVDYSRAPPPPKPDKNAEPVTPTTTIVVMGDGMADWLAYGLEDAFSDSPEVAIVRKNKRHSGLIRYQWKSDLDWWHVARDDLKDQPANYVVMMLGVSDRRNISERDVAKQAEKERQEKKQNAAGQDAKQADNSDQSPTAAPKHKYPRGVIPFRSDRWAHVYSHRIDATIAALKSKGVPVFWVGLPSIRGSRSTANAVYLNDLYRAAAERSGIKYIDIWDGFVDDGGKYSSYGPDYEGQTRRLRSGDGVYFTKYGARKLAHYVEREIRRYMNNRAVVSLPTGPIGPVPGLGKSKERPLAGPVVPLTVVPGNVDTLAGGPGMRPSYGDAIASEVLVKGDALKAPLGRADDFAWPPGSDANKKPAETSATKPAAPAAAVANAAPTATAHTAKKTVRVIVPGAPAAAAKPATPIPPPAPIMKREETRQPAQARKPAEAKPVEAKKPAEPKSTPAERSAQNRAPQSVPVPPARSRPAHHPTRRNSDPLFGPNGLFGWMHH